MHHLCTVLHAVLACTDKAEEVRSTAQWIDISEAILTTAVAYHLS